MKTISFISHFYNHPEKVLEQIAFWETLPNEILQRAEFILVDDCSEDCPAYRPTSLDLRIYRVETDIPWNQAGARNLGAFHAKGDWAMYFDIDQRFYATPMLAILQSLGTLNPMAMYYFRIKELIDITANKSLANHPNTFLVNMEKFREMGMYDEDFAGHYGYEDLYMPRVWERNGGTRVLFNDIDFFEDTNFGTSNLNRDLSRNLALAEDKVRSGLRNSPGILRFDWSKITIPSGGAA